MTENRNLLLAIALSVAILIGFEYVYGLIDPKPSVDPQAPKPQTATETTERRAEGATPSAQAPGAAAVLQPTPTQPRTAVPGLQPGANRASLLAASPRIRIDTPRLHGSIALIGGRLDDLTLADYREGLDAGSPEIVLLSPQGMAGAYFADVGWDDGGAGIEKPKADTEWTADHATLTQKQPVTLSWDNGAGLTFKRTFTVDQNYLFTVTESVENATGEAVNLYPYALVSRFGTPEVSGFFILHEGPLGVFDGTLKEVDYDELQEAGTIKMSTQGGWIGVTDKYWLTALVPEQQEKVNARFVHHRVSNADIYQVDLIGDGLQVPAGGTAAWRVHVFAGAKEVRLLDDYAEQLNIAGFDRAIDFGWFYFLTKPLFYFLIYIREYVGNFGVAILLLTVAIKLLFFPLANKSYKAMSQLRRLQPEMLKLRERFGEDRVRLNQEMMALYKREKVNPASGCLPMVIQIPVFFALYKVLFVTIEMRHAPFFGWIQDLSARDPTTVFNLFGAIPWTPPDLLMIGAWPLIMGVTMYLQQKLNPQPPDPVQAKVFMALPFIFTVMLAQFPAGLVIYWTWNNILSIGQQWVIMRRAGRVTPAKT
jgi:YidC/Oxa1 family membrane protein insertase